MSVILLWVSSAHLSPLKCGVFFFFVSLSTSCCGVEYWKHFRVRYYRVISGYWLSWGLFWQHRSAFCSPHMALFGLCWVRFNVKMISFLPRWDGEVFFICHFFPLCSHKKRMRNEQIRIPFPKQSSFMPNDKTTNLTFLFSYFSQMHEHNIFPIGFSVL